MAIYGTLEGVRGILRRSLDWSTLESKGGVTTEEITPHLDRAENELRSQLSRFYRFPLNSIGIDFNTGLYIWPYPITDIVQHLAASYLVNDKFGETDPNQSMKSKSEFARCEALLSNIINGWIVLQGNFRHSENFFTNGEIENVNRIAKVKYERSVQP